MSDAEFAHIIAERHFVEQALAQVRLDTHRCTAPSHWDSANYWPEFICGALGILAIIAFA